MENLIYATIATPRSAPEVLLLTESLRTFGGEMEIYPLLLLTPRALGTFSDEYLEKFEALNVRLNPIDLDEETLKFPFAALAHAAAQAEQHVKGECELLVWMLTDTLVVNPPNAFLIPKEITCAYRPVHHTKVGSIYEKPLDKFWSAIYKHCEVPEARVFPMETCVRDNVLRPYFNAGMLVVRPEKGLLSSWWDTFERIYRHPDFETFYKQDELYEIFIHQAVLAGVILNRLEPGELQELPEAINYPLHLHEECPPEYRAETLNELSTFRYEGIEELREALKGIQVNEPLKSWLEERLKISDE